MPGPITYATIALMARDRLARLVAALDVKESSGGFLTTVDKQVRYLARIATRVLTDTQPVFLSPQPIYGGAWDAVPKFFLLGAVGPDLPKYSLDLKAPRNWVWNTLHKGTADENREQVMASSTEFVLTLLDKSRPLIDAEFAGDDKGKTQATQQIGAYVLGHLCHVAADVISHPFFDDVAGHLGEPGAAALDRDQVAGAFDARLFNDFFGYTGGTRARDLGDWWPSNRDMPDAFFGAFKQAFDQVYPVDRRRGFAEFETALAADHPPELTPSLLRDAFFNFRNIVEGEFTIFDWMATAVWMSAPLLLALPLAATLPMGQYFYRPTARPSDYDNSAAKFELATLPFSIMSWMPATATLLQTSSLRGGDLVLVFGWISAAVQLLFGIFFWAFGRGAGHAGAKWALLFALPLILEALFIFLVYPLAGGGRDRRHLMVLAGASAHLAAGLLFLLFYHVWFHDAADALHDPVDVGKFFGGLGKLFLIVVVLWFLIWFFFNLATRNLPLDANLDFVTNNRHGVRLYDDGTLYHLPSAPSPPTLATSYFPSGRRPLFKLWWGPGAAGAPTLLSLRDRLQFQPPTVGAGPAPAPIVVWAPVAPTKISELAALLTSLVGAQLKTSAVPADADYELPPGELFSDNGDGEAGAADHDRLAAVPLALGKDEATTPATLYHAPKLRQSVRFGPSGPRGPLPQQGLQITFATTITAVGTTVTISAADPLRPLETVLRDFDVIETIEPTPQRRVVTPVAPATTGIVGATRFTINLPFATALPGAGVGWRRLGIDRSRDQPAPQGVTVTSPVTPAPGPPPTWTTTNTLTAPAGFAFGGMFAPPDQIRLFMPKPYPSAAQNVTQQYLEAQLYTVTAVTDATLTLDRPLSDGPPAPPPPPPPPAPPPPVLPPVLANIGFARVGRGALDDDFRYLADPDDALGAGGEIMNHAADLATLLCLGGVSHLMSDAQRSAGEGPHDVSKVYEVFRNWNLDRRRVNEWRMLVLGGAASEAGPRGDGIVTTHPAPALPFAAAITTRELGWLPLFRRWFAMARNPASVSNFGASFFPGEKQNLELENALAYLLDITTP